MRFQGNERLTKLILLFSILFVPSLLLYADSNGSYILNSINNEREMYCSTCHTPNDLTNSSEPLYISKETPHRFETYANSTNFEPHGFPLGETKLCLGCHDGTVAIEDKNVYTNSSIGNNSAVLAFSSHNDHPVSFIYNTSLAISKGDLADPSTTLSGLGGTIEEDLLEDGKIVCTSCHSIHLSMNGNSPSNHFNKNNYTSSVSLKISNEESKLCLTCHKK